MAEVATSVNGVAMEVMAELALKVCALFIEDPVERLHLHCTLTMRQFHATIPHGGSDDSSLGRSAVNTVTAVTTVRLPPWSVILRYI